MNKKINLTEKMAKNTNAGGVVVGKRRGQTMIFDDATAGGYFVGKLHSEGGIKAINKSTGQPIEVQGAEVIITAPAVADQTKREFDGKMMTNREILSTINERGGGVAFAESGMEIPTKMHFSGSSYNYGGKMLSDHDIAYELSQCGCEHEMKKGGSLAKGMSLKQIAKMHDVTLRHINRQVSYGMEAESEHTSSKATQLRIVKDHLYENPNYYTILKTAGLKRGGKVGKEDLVKDSKSGNTPARDLNNYNDLMDVGVDGEVGGANGLAFAKGGQIENVEVLNWDEVPTELKKITKVKKVPFENDPMNEGLLNIILPFLSYNDLRPALMGVNFDENGITATDAHLLMTLPYPNKKYEGVYDLKYANKSKADKPILMDYPYPNYKGIIPYSYQFNSNPYEISTYKLLQYTKSALNYADKDIHGISYKFGDNESIGFDGVLLLKILNTALKLGHEKLYAFILSPNKVMVLTPSKDYQFGRDELFLTMPIMLQFNNIFAYGTEDTDYNRSLKVYYDFNDDEIHNADGSVADFQLQYGSQKASTISKKPTQAKDDFSFLDDIDNVFYVGGTIGNEKVNSVKITSQSSAYNALNAKTFDSYKELKKAVREEFDNQNKRAGYFYFEVNGKPPRFGIQIKNGKNTVLNFNPNTGDADDFEKQLLRRGSFSYKKYDWNDWYSGNVSSSALASFSTNLGQQTQNIFSPSEILEIDQLPDTNFGVDNKVIINLPETIRKLVRLREFEYKGLTNTDTLGGAFRWGKTIEGLNFWQKIEDGDFREFKKMYGSGASGSTTSAKSTTQTIVQPSIANLQQSKIWIGDNVLLRDAVITKLKQLGIPEDDILSQKDAKKNISITIWSEDFLVGELNSKQSFDASTREEIYPADLGIDVNNLGGASTTQQLPTDLSQIPKSRMAVLFEIKKFVDDKNLTPNPAVVETLSNTIDFVDEETGDVFEFTWGNGLLNPITKVASNLLFEFLDFQKGFDSFVGKKIKDISDGVADLDMLAVSEVRTFEKEKKEIDALIKLLPAFQESKFAPQKATIIKEIGRLHKKITYEGFIFQNERYSDAKQLFTPQGLLKYYYNQTTQSPVAPLEPACELPTPNGAKSKLPLSTYFNVRTSRFKKWFGDWEKAYETNNYVDCSKMIDEETKEPKIFYHGVRKYVPNFGQFSNMGQGVVRPYGSFEPPTAFPASYFSDSEDYAKFYGGEAPNMPKPSPDYEPFIYKVFLSAKNPISLLPLGFESSYKDMIDYLLVAYGVRVQPSRNVLSRIQNDMKAKHPLWVYVRNDVGLLETLKDYGYDSLIQTGDIPTFDDSGNVINDRTKFIQDEEYLTFYPTQVKSATVKKSFYFDFFKDIRFKQGGYVRI
jgi:hypothetical protein